MIIALKTTTTTTPTTSARINTHADISINILGKVGQLYFYCHKATQFVCVWGGNTLQRTPTVL